jgi:PIN domain nuclease of toxin-antitoxin system
VRLLLDSHALVWWVTDDARLGPQSREAIGAADTVAASVASAWELGIKFALGRLDLDVALEDLFADFDDVPVLRSHALAASRLPLIHRDPFDRLLIAQAQIEGRTLVTTDGFVKRYDVRTLDASR